MGGIRIVTNYSCGGTKVVFGKVSSLISGLVNCINTVSKLTKGISLKSRTLSLWLGKCLPRQPPWYRLRGINGRTRNGCAIVASTIVSTDLLLSMNCIWDHGFVIRMSQRDC